MKDSTKYLLLSLTFFISTSANKQPFFTLDRSSIVHLFEWNWQDIAEECENFLGPKGYGGVQISPPNEVSVIEGNPWWARYQPVSYQLVSRSGNEKDLADMIDRCNGAGVRIYVDIVVNHMTGYDESKIIGTAGNVADYMASSYPAVPYGPEHFHAACDIQDYQDAVQVRNCQLVTLKDLNQTIPHVREMIVNYMNKLIDMGVAGFRIDAAKHMWPEDLEAIYSQLHDLRDDLGFPNKAKPYIYQEVIDLGGEAVKKAEYSPLAAVTEFQFSQEIGRIFRNKVPLKKLGDWGTEWGMLPSDDVIVFVDNHDNQRGHGAGGGDILTFKQPDQYKLAVAFMLAHPYGRVTRVMSSFNFTSTDEGPPATEEGDIKAPEFLENNMCDTNKVGWVCEHRWPAIQQMVLFRNAAGGKPLENWWEKGENQIGFSRGDSGFIIFNMDFNKELKEILQTGLHQGVYCDILNGMKQHNNCTGSSVAVNETGFAEIYLPPGVQALAISILSKL